MTFKRVHMIGIGGIGMSGLARLFLHEGKEVSGSDRAPSDITRALAAEGAHVFEGHNEANVGEVDLVVYTEAVNEKTEGYVELQKARVRGIRTMNYFEALASVANQYYLIAVAGTHGKTTTTAMLIDILEEAGLDPTAIVGSLRSRTKSNYRAGKSKYFVVEACEYKRDFQHLEPDVLVITNIEAEHLDYYKDLADVQSAFRALAEKVPEDGVVVAQTADPNVAPILAGLQATVIDYKKYLDLGLLLTQPGLHNRMNAAAATAAADFLGIESSVSKSAIENFAGTWRRFEFKGHVNGAPVHDDYGHHPTEIRATIAGAREKYPGKKLAVVYQPHMYSRTHELFDDFVTALHAADRVVLVPIYAAREENTSGVSSEQLVDALKEKGTDAQFFHTFEAAAEAVRESVSQDDAVLVMGAGDVTNIAGSLTA